MSGGNSHAAGEPHNGACAFGADCGHATIIDKVELASLREQLDELRTELESHVNADAAWKIQVGDLREQLAAAEAERDEIQGNLERATEAFLSWRERAGRAEAERDAVIQSARNDLRSHNAAMDLSAKVLADVRAERDELRGLLERWAAVAELAGVEAFSLRAAHRPHNSVTRLLHDLRAALPAIPEGTPARGKGP